MCAVEIRLSHPNNLEAAHSHVLPPHSPPLNESAYSQFLLKFNNAVSLEHDSFHVLAVGE